ncbi:hypothetical protein ACFY2K_35470 [Kitasatospora sp. NPDC001309]|uniref:hypothetical protein n=1 Tax=Kitasatospora sp. NPDC001309 TaxID=3364013 RepID=UPI0036A5731B
MTETTPAEAPARDGARSPRRAVTLRLDLRTLAALGLAGAGFITGTLVMGSPATAPVPGAQPAPTPVVPTLTASPVQLGTGAPTAPALPTPTPMLPTLPAPAPETTPATLAVPTASQLSPAPVLPSQTGEQSTPSPAPTVTVTVTHVQTGPTVGAPSPTGGPSACIPNPSPSPTGEVSPTPGPNPIPTPTPTSTPVTPGRPTPSR